MSLWTSITGVILVDLPGSTTEQNEYILKTVLNHLPKVEGSEGPMDLYINKKVGYNYWSSCDEYDQYSETGLSKQSIFLITIASSLRDREYDDTYRDFVKWLMRLSKRIRVTYVSVEISGYVRRTMKYVTNDIKLNDLVDLCELPYLSGSKYVEYEIPWVQHLLPLSVDSRCDYPAILWAKYYEDTENDNYVSKVLRLDEEQK